MQALFQIIKSRSKLILLIVFFHLAPLNSQINQDLSSWFWVQLYQKLPKDFYVGFQYQLRLNNNISQFNLSNFYVLAGYDINKYLNAEILYQFNTSYNKDGHTFYGGLTAKYPYKKFTFYFRTSFQHRRNYFTDIYDVDKIKNEWRNKIKIRYRFNKFFNICIFTEPYLLFTETRPAYFSRIRSGFQATVSFNKYQSLTIFYLNQPDIITYKKPQMLHVIGLTWTIQLPKSYKNFKKLFKSKIFRKEYNKSSDVDNLNESQ